MHDRRNFGLDLARSTAITMVYLSHGITAAGNLGAGVDLFFVLSGFLIGRIYFRSQAGPKFSRLEFWKARWWRTLPPYYAALGLIAALSLRFPGNPIRWYYLFFAQNYAGMAGFGPSWSLCVEEHFYLLLPLLGYVVERTLGRRSYIWLLPVATVVPMLLRLWFLRSGVQPPRGWYWMTHFHSEGLVLGVWLALLHVDHHRAWDALRGAAFLLSSIPFVLLILQKVFPAADAHLRVPIFLLWALGFSGWVRLLYDLQWEPVSSAARVVKGGIQGLALCSYSVYLVHVVLFTDIRMLVAGWPRGPLKSIFILGATFLGALVFYFAVERPSIAIRDRYLKPRREGAPAPIAL